MKQWIQAPESGSQPVNGAVLGVSLDPGERVEWAYTILPDGRRIVTGYDILPAAKLSKRTKKKPAAD
jgi:hypothetical protein